MKRRTILNTTGQLEICKLNSMDIEVSIGGRLEYTGKLVRADDEVIEVTDGFYLRNNCIIRVKKKP